MPINWELFRLAADHIEKDFESFDMRTFGYNTHCGTIACFAGHVVWANDPDEFLRLVQNEDGNGIEAKAKKLLRTTNPDLFYGGDLLFDQIRANKAKVPAALRWMADNRSTNWRAAAVSVGFEL